VDGDEDGEGAEHDGNDPTYYDAEDGEEDEEDEDLQPSEPEDEGEDGDEDEGEAEARRSECMQSLQRTICSAAPAAASYLTTVRRTYA
jgi:hypothetical protein